MSDLYNRDFYAKKTNVFFPLILKEIHDNIYPIQIGGILPYQFSLYNFK